MKTTLINLSLVCIAFIIGLSINQACADTLNNNDDTQELIYDIQKQIEELQENASVREIDNLKFGPDGRVCSRPLLIEGNHGLIDLPYEFEEVSEKNLKTTFEYDKLGRMTEFCMEDDGISVTCSVNYNGKVVTISGIWKNYYPDGTAITTLSEVIHYE